MVAVRPAFRLAHNLVHNAKLLQILRGDFHRFRRGFRLRGIAPHNRCASFRRNHRIKTILQNIHAVAHRHGERAARSTFARHRYDDRNGQPRHFAQISRNRFTLAAFLRVNSRVCAGSINERQHRAMVLRRELHHAQRLPITLRLRLAKIANHALFCVASLLVTDHRDGASVEFRQPRDDCFVVSEGAVAVQLHKIREQVLHKIQQVRPLLMPRDLRSLPRPKMGVKFAPQLRNFLSNALELRVRFCRSGKPLQIFHIFLQSLDLALSLYARIRSGFTFCFHSLS